MAEPMITIKKADGTFAKVPLSEFKKMQTGQQKPVASAEHISQPTPTPPKRGIDESPKPSHVAPTHHKPAHHQAAAHHTTKHHAPTHTKHHPAKQMSRTDAGSPLEEKLKIKNSTPLFSPRREKQVEEVLQKLGFSVPSDVLGRLKSLILAKLKDIKSEEETRELLERSIKNGGLGLTTQQAEKILVSCRDIEGLEGVHTEVPALKGKANISLMVEPEELPALASDVKPMLYNKIDSFRPAAVPTVSVAQKQEVVSKIVGNNADNEPIFKLDTKPLTKQSMQDITASSIEMGPVEEIKSITLMDFRRLSGNPEEAAKRLQQKMFNLQEESFVWYLEALAAYHNSPLYLEYIQAVCQSLAERKSLANVLSLKNGIKLNEAMALIEMEKGL